VAGARVAGGFEDRSHECPTGTLSMDEDHTKREMGLDPLDTRCQNPGDPPKAYRSAAGQTQQRSEKALLLYP